MAKPRKLWGSYTRAYRDRATKEAAKYGISRRSAREMFNRGTFKPFVKNTAERVPQKVVRQRNREPQPPPEPPKKVEQESPPRDTRDTAAEKKAHLLALIDFQLQDRLKFTHNAQSKFADKLDSLSEKTVDGMLHGLDIMSAADLAQYRKPSDAPKEIRKIVRSFFYKDENGNWVNPFWYHP